MELTIRIIGIIILVIYFGRRMYWLSKTNYHNIITKNEESSSVSLGKAHDLVSWLLLLFGFGLVLFSFS